MITIIFTLSLLASPLPTVYAIDDEPTGASSDISRWIKNLGSEEWSVREEAARKLLDAGPAAIGALRSSLMDPDPEVRARIKEMLSLLSPPVLIVDVVRVGNSAEGSWLSRRTDLDSTSIRFSRNELIQSSVTSATEERRIQVEIRGTEAPYSVEILFPGVNSTIVSGPPARGLDPGVPWVVLSEERVAMEHALGKTTTEGEFATWVAVLHHDPPEELERLKPAERVRRAMIEHLPHTDDPALWMLASIWPEEQPLPATTRGESPRIRDAHTLARLSSGDTTARNDLTRLVADHLDGSDTLAIRRIDALIPGLIEAQIDRSSELLIRHCGDLSPWRQHLTWHTLLQRIEDPQFASTHGKSLIEAILSPAALPILRWTNSRMASLWSALHRHVPSGQWMEALDGRIRNALEEDLAQASGRIPLILGTLAFLSNRSEALPKEWLSYVSELIPSQHAEIAIGVLASQMQHLKEVPEEIWLQVCKGFATGLASSDTTIGFRVRNSVTRFSEFRFLSPAIRRTLFEMLIEVLATGSNNHRSTAAQLLSKNLGRPATPQLRTRDQSYWTAQAKYWKERLESLEDDQLYPEIDANRWVRLTLADFRIDPEGKTDPLRIQRVVLQVGRRLVSIEDNGEDESIQIEATAGNTHRLSGSILLVAGRPVLARLRPRWRRWVHRVSSARLGSESAQSRSLVTYQTLVLMEVLGADEALDQPGWETEPSWQGIEQILLTQMRSPQQTIRNTVIDIVTTLQLESAREPLIALWKNSQSEAVARALLALGDLRGRDLLFKGIQVLEKRATREAQKSMEQLLLLGDLETVHLVLGWLETPASERNRILENQLPVALRAIESWVASHANEDNFPRERLLSVLVQRCDTRNLRNYSIPLLRRLTGEDMGWWNTFSITDSSERIEAQEEIAARWRGWWKRRSERSADPVKMNPPRDR